MPEHLFVCGVGRSGTTALTRVLDGHPDIAIGMERYKMLWRRGERIDELVPDLFARERFFDFSDGLTNLTPDSSQWKAYYKKLAGKYDRARYVGDKMTEVLVPEVIANIPDARFIVIVREVAALAHSWDVRAKDPTDPGWGANRDALAAVGHWNRGLQRTMQAATDFPDQVTVVEYGSFFSDPQAGPLRATLARLGLDWDDGVGTAFASAHAQYRELIESKPRVLEGSALAYIDEKANMERWRLVTKLAV